MKLKNNIWYRILAIIFLFTVLTSIWFLTKKWLPEGNIIVGHDSGLALNAKNFLESRLYAWDDNQNFGIDNSAFFGSIVIHGIDYLTSIVTDVPFAGNQLNVFLWLSTIFISAYIFANSFKDKFGKAFIFFFPIFVTLNFYILQAVFILERAKYGLYAALILFMVVVFKLLKKKISLLAAAIVTAFIFTIFNGGSWLGLPLFGGVLVFSFTLLIYQLFISIKKKEYSSIKKLISLFILSGVFFVILNSYSIWPYLLKFRQTDIHSVVDVGVVSSGKNWLDFISKGTSFLNLFRLQGIPDWYSGKFEADPIHAYAAEYMSNPRLVFCSYIFPVIIIGSFFFIRKRKDRYLVNFFSLLLLVSMFFVAGTHRPLGFIYSFLYRRIPGFSIFRSPYFKFASPYIISISVLISFYISSLLDSLQKRFKHAIPLFLAQFLLFGLAIYFWLSYFSVGLNPEKIFNWQPNLSTNIQIPDYVFKMDEYFNKNSFVDKGKVLLLPPLNDIWKNDAYNWGYWSLSPLLSSLQSVNFIINSSNAIGSEGEWIKSLYKAIEDNQYEQFLNLAGRFNIEYILLRNDVLADKSWSAANQPQTYSLFIRNLTGGKPLVTFGEWQLFRVNSKAGQTVLPISFINQVPDGQGFLMQSVGTNLYTTFQKNIEDNMTLENMIKSKFWSAECISCDIDYIDYYQSLPEASILPSSPFYYIKLLKEKWDMREAIEEKTQLEHYLSIIVRRAPEVATMLDRNWPDRYPIENLKLISGYLEAIREIQEKVSSSGKDFYRVKQIYATLTPFEIHLKQYFSRDSTKYKSHELRSRVLETLWLIRIIKDYYKPITDDIAYWEGIKLYEIVFPREGIYKIYIDSDTLPKNLTGDLIYPLVKYKYHDKGERRLEFSGSDIAGLLQADISVTKDEVNIPFELVLEFNNIPNVYRFIKNKQVTFLEGERYCSIGTIGDSVPKKLYRFSFSGTEENDKFRVFFDEQIELDFKKSGFLQAVGEFDIVAEKNKAFIHLYESVYSDKQTFVYLCNQKDEYPSTSGITIREIFKPTLIVQQDLPTSTKTLPVIVGKKVKPTKYTFEVNQVSDSFILIFNEKYTPLWELNIMGDKDYKPCHFKVNDHVNAWMIEKVGDFSGEIIYTPQRNFEKGKIVTMVGGIILAAVLFFDIRKKKR